MNVGVGFEARGSHNPYEWDAWHAALGPCRRRVQVIMMRGKALLVERMRVRLDAR